MGVALLASKIRSRLSDSKKVGRCGWRVLLRCRVNIIMWTEERCILFLGVLFYSLKLYMAALEFRASMF